ncbi:mevalonate kinase [Culex quinquefasciatus]|uniref:Mevalonate kinase n=1 Tax=Culex quinquefasciatus TaxID=7176 RepID=B0WW94_CULQU|nr:mevalonate kinase [Culex quinquefasciatus]|eukprot:XP_001861666.1 mevalonate kinase [Culex quinquefasciatus]
MHERPSGIDNTICTYGNLIKFKRGKPLEGLKLRQQVNIPIVDTGVSRTTAKLVAGVADLKNRHPGMLDSMGHLVDDVVSILKVDGDRFEELRTLVSINGDRRLRKTLLSMEPHFVGHDDLNHLLQLLEQHSLIISEKSRTWNRTYRAERRFPNSDGIVSNSDCDVYRAATANTFTFLLEPEALLDFGASRSGWSSANNFSANLLKIADQTVKPLMLIFEHFGMVLVQDPVADSLRSVPFTLSYDQAEIVVSEQGTVTRKKLHNRNETGAVTEPERLVQGRTESCRARSKRVRIGTSGSPGLLINLVPACRNLSSWLPYRRKTSRATIFNLCCQSGVRSNKSLEFNAAVDVELA